MTASSTPGPASPLDPMHIYTVRACRAAEQVERDMFRIDGPPPAGIGTLLKRAVLDPRPKATEDGAA